MGYLPVVVGIEDFAGVRVDAKRADGTRSAVVLRIGDAFSTGYEFDGGLTRVFLGLDGWEVVDGVLTIGGGAPVTSVVLGAAGIPVSVPDALDVGGDLTVTGDLTVEGTTTSIQSTVLDVADRVIHVNDSDGADDPVPVDIAGIAVHRGAAGGVDRDHAGWLWDEVNVAWVAAWNTGGDDATVGAYLDIHAQSLYVADGYGVRSFGAYLYLDAIASIGFRLGEIPTLEASVSYDGFVFESTATATVTQSDTIGAGATASTLTVKGSNATGGGGSTGASVELQPGSGDTHGSLYAKDGTGTIRVTIDNAGYVQLNGLANYLQSETWAPGDSPVDGAIGINNVIASQVFS